MANIASALFGGLIAGGSMSASAVKEGAGARAQVSNLVTWVATLVTLLFLTPLFAPLPEAVLTVSGAGVLAVDLSVARGGRPSARWPSGQ